MVMSIREHAETAREFLRKADQEFSAGEHMQGSEKLWGAASQAMITVARQRGWPCATHNALRNAAGNLSIEYGDNSLRDGFAVAEKFHANFYHGFMEAEELEFSRPSVEEFVEKILSLTQS